MDLDAEVDDYIKETIEYTLGLPVSTKTLELKLLASEEARKRLQEHVFLLQDRLKEQDERLDRSRAEASMNALALKKYIEENQRLVAECTELSSQCVKWEKECTLYDRDREALMEFSDDADKRAEDAEGRAINAEKDLRRLADELQYYKSECDLHRMNEARANEELQAMKEKIEGFEGARLEGCAANLLGCNQCSLLKKENQVLQSQLISTVPGDLSGVDSTLEGHALNSLIASILAKDECTGQVKHEAGNARSFLEAYAREESCQTLLKLWESLNPLTTKILALAAEVESLQKDKDHLRTNLHTAEEEVKVLFEENNVLDEENKRLLRQCSRERHHKGSDGKHSASISAKSKRKSSPKSSSFEGRKIDFSGPDSPRKPLSPVQYNSPESRMHKK